LGEADAGFVYQTDVTSAVASKLIVIPIPDNFNVIAEYPIAVVKNSAHASDAQAFVQYILSSDGQAILAKFHFLSITS
jgi:molybdate transport system substrate-binding protein